MVGIVGYGSYLPRYRIKVEEIAKLKFEDLNAYVLESAVKIIEGTAKSMGVTVTES